VKSTRLFKSGFWKKLRPRSRAPRVRRWSLEPLESRRMFAIDLPAVIEIDTNHNGLLDVPEIEALADSIDSGTYIFARLNTGMHHVRVAPAPVGFLESNETLITLDFRGAASGVKWNDLNGDSLRDPGEPGVAGVRIFADLNGDGLFADGEPFTLTGPDGSYRLVLPPGLYSIREQTPPGTMQTFPFGAPGGVLPAFFAGEAATDPANPFHNEFEPADVNDDGVVSVRDALNLIQELRVAGARALGGEGESSASQTLYVDVNDDLTLSVADLVGVVFVLRGEGEPTLQDDEFMLGANTQNNVLNVLGNDQADGQMTIIGLGTVEQGIVGLTAQGDRGGAISVQNNMVRYTPSPDFYGIERFIYEVRDSADNATAQAEVTVNVIPDRDYMRFTYQVFQTDGVTPATSIEIGQEFLLRVFIQDDRVNFTPSSQRGVFSAFLDVTYNETLLDLVTSPPGSNPHGFSRDVRFGANYQELVSIDGFQPGLINEAAATQTDGFELGTQPLGPGAITFLDARFRATGTGSITFAGNAPDDPRHQEVFFRPSNLEPLDPAFVDFGQLTITVTPPIGAVPDSFTRNEDLEGPPGDPLTNPILDLLANDNPFVPGQPLTISGLGPTNAAVIFTSNGGRVEIINNGAAVSYTPPLNHTGSDSFTYTATDGVRSETAVVTVNLLPINDPPTATGDTFAADNQAVLIVEAPGVLGNDFDVDGDTISLVGSQSVSALGAPVTVNNTGRFTYNPTVVPELQNLGPGEFRVDTFTYTISDGRGETATATVRIIVARNTGGAHVVEILPGHDIPNLNFGNTSLLQGEAELEAAIESIAEDLI
jgi:VCBS repeat-containing protein